MSFIIVTIANFITPYLLLECTFVKGWEGGVDGLWEEILFLSHWCLCARNCPWRTLAFLPLLTSSLLTKIGITYTQLLQEEMIFPVMPRSEWSTKWSLRYAQNAQKVEWKTQSKISCHCTWLLHAKNCPSLWCFLRSFLTASKPCRRLIIAAKEKRKGEKGKANKKFQTSKSLKTQVTLISAHARVTMH